MVRFARATLHLVRLGYHHEDVGIIADATTIDLINYPNLPFETSQDIQTLRYPLAYHANNH
jgi:hypothetical protein